MGIVLKNGNLIDGTGRMIKNAVVVMEGSAITAVGEMEEMRIPYEDSQVIELGGMTIMPGLMDLHDHLHGDSTDYRGGKPHDRFGEEVNFIEDHDAYLALLMVGNAKKALESGFTTIRDTGAPRDITIDIARAARDGLFVGPRILYCASVDITMPAGKRQVHGVVGGNITGPVEAIRVTREKIGSGADWIHLIATGAGAGLWGPEALVLNLDEMEAATAEAHKLGKRVTANANGAQGIRNAVVAGADCIEHGAWLHEDDDLIKMMVDRRVGWVPTVRVNIAKKEKKMEAEARGQKIRIPDYWLNRELEIMKHRRLSFEKAMAAGMLVAIGTDSGAPYMVHGNNAIELEMFVDYGATEMQAIEAATRVPAEILGMADRLGTVQVGKEADVIVVRKDPLKDIRVLQEMENIALVIKGGKIVVDRRNKTAVEAR
jgi:imidazolonepropionase-like amidohydrolase